MDFSRAFLLMAVITVFNCQRSDLCSCHKNVTVCSNVWDSDGTDYVREFTGQGCSASHIIVEESDMEMIPEELFASSEIRNITLNVCTMEEIPFSLITSACGFLEFFAIYKSPISTGIIPGGRFQCFQKLRHLIIAGSEIVKIEPEAFKDLINLRTLDLSENHLHSLDARTFQGLNKLTVLNMYNSRLKLLEDGLFDPISQTIQQISLAENPLKCDCSLQWLKDWIRRQFKKKNFSYMTYSEESKTSLTTDLTCDTPETEDFETFNFCHVIIECTPETVFSYRVELLTAILDDVIAKTNVIKSTEILRSAVEVRKMMFN